MHAAMESGGCSPKRLNSLTSTQQLKSSLLNLQNNGTPFSSQIKGKKRGRAGQTMEPIKRESTSKADNGDSTFSKFYKLKAEISKIIEKGVLISTDGVEKLVQFMHIDTDKQIDLAVRVLLADVIAATDRIDCLLKFVQIRGVPVLDEWLQEAHKGKAGDGSSPKESDKDVEELLLSLLRALDKLPVNLNALQTCNIGKSVNYLRSHKNLQIQKKARSLVDTWKKRVDAEMKTNEANPVGSNQAVTLPVKNRFSEVVHRQTASAELSIKSSIIQQSTTHADDIIKPAVPMEVSAKLHSFSSSPLVISSKGSLPKETNGDESLDSTQMAAKEEKSSSSSQSHDNILSCSSDHAKAIALSLKEDARISVARSTNSSKIYGNSYRHRTTNGFMPSNISVVQKETNTNKSASVNRSLVADKDSFSVVKYDNIYDMPASGNGNSYKFIIRLPNPGLSPARSSTGGSLKDSSAGSRVSSPGIHEKYDHGDQADQTHNTADVNVESCTSSDDKEGLVESSGVNVSPIVTPAEELRGAGEVVRAVEISRASCSSSGGSPIKDNPCSPTDEAKLIFCTGDAGGQNLDSHDKNADIDYQKDGKDEIQEISPTIIDVRKPLHGDFIEDFDRDVHQNKNKQGKVSDGFTTGTLDTGSPLDENEEKAAEESMSSNSDHNTLSNGVGDWNYGKQSASGEVQGHPTLNGQQSPSIAEIEKELDGVGAAVTFSTADRNLSAEEYTRFAASDLGIAIDAGIVERKGSLESCVAASDGNDELHMRPREADASARKEELESLSVATSFVTTVEQGAAAKLDFDLNEGIPEDDLNQSELLDREAHICSTEIMIPSLSLFASSPVSNGLLSPVTIAALAEGSFLSLDNFLSNKGKPGWKGSATTSAFRPAEPRKFLEIPPYISDVKLSESAMAKHGHHLLDFDLNVPDEKAQEEMNSQNSFQKIGSEADVISNLDASARAIPGLDFDLNGFYLGPESGNCSTSSICRLQELQFPEKSASRTVPQREVNILRDVNPNIRRAFDVVDTELVPKSASSLPFVPSGTGLTMDNAELGMGWFPAGNSYQAAFPSFLPDKGEPSPPIVAAAGGHRIFGSVAGAAAYRSDIYSGPFISSSPAMAFSPAATAFSYAGFPFSSGFPVTSTSFSAGSKNFVDSASVGSCVPPIASQLVGPAVSVSSPYLRPYVVRLPNGSASGGSEGNRKWASQVFDLNSGPGSVDEVKDRLPITSRQIPDAGMQTIMEDHERLYQVRDGSLKRKEPEGSWDTGRFIYRQPSWQ